MDLRGKYSVPAIVCAALCGACGGVLACEIPVYQYALEFWPADPYTVVVFHRGTLSDDAGQAVAVLQEGAERANIDLHVVDRDAGHHPLGHLAPDEDAGQGPSMVVRYPGVAGSRPVLWSGPLDVDTARSWLDSPARRTIAQRLLAREAAVWVLLASGDRREDRQARQRLEEELGRLERTMRPAALAIDPDTGGPQKIAFSVYRLDRDDPAEAPFVKMLLHSEPDLAQRDEPMVFPIFGRGLILYALVGGGINAWTIAEAAEFLVGPCSCQVKELSPGLDIILEVDWDAQVKTTDWGTATPLVGVTGFSARAERAERLLSETLPGQEVDEPPPEDVTGTSSERRPRPTRRYLLGIVLVVVVLWTAVRSVTGRPVGRRR